MIQWKWELNTADDDNDLQQNTDEKKKPQIKVFYDLTILAVNEIKTSQ